MPTFICYIQEGQNKSPQITLQQHDSNQLNLSPDGVVVIVEPLWFSFRVFLVGPMTNECIAVAKYFWEYLEKVSSRNTEITLSTVIVKSLRHRKVNGIINSN